MDLDAQYTRAAHLGRVGRHAGVLPAGGEHAVGYEFHGVEFLFGALDEGGVAEEDGGPVVVVVAVGREGQY